MPNANGYHDWSVGENPSAADFDNYVSAQLVGLYDDATDLGTQLPVPTADGQRVYLRDTGVDAIAMLDPAAINNPLLISDYTYLELGRTKAWDTSHAPTLTATGTSPTIGTGPVLSCRWTREGTLATVAFYVAFGTSGSAAGTGTYELDLPPELPAAASWFGATEWIAGNGIAIDTSTSTRHTVAIAIVGANTIRLEADGLTGAVTESNLLAWADGDVVLSGVITYETEEVY